MRMLGAVFGAVVLGFGLVAGGEARACDTFQRIDNVQLKALLDQVKDPKVPELDRGFAFETLVCDDRPYVREQAMREAMAAADSPMLRSIILTEILYQLRTLRLELQDGPQLDEPTRRYVRDKKGVIPISLGSKIAALGCINIDSSSTECRGGQRILIRGTKIDLKFQSDADGSLELKDGGLLVGYYRPYPSLMPIPARISLF